MAKHDQEIQRLIDIVNTSAVNRISKPFKVEDAYKPKQKEELKEAIKIQTDTPEEAMAMMQILKNAGIEQKMPDMDRPDMPMKDMDEEEIEQGADYRNSPDEQYDDDEILDTYSTKPNKQKTFRRTNGHGDNPLSMAEQLMAEWQESKNTTEEELQQVKEYYVKTADDVMVNLPAFAYRKSNPSHDNTPKDEKYVAAIGDKADMVHSKLKKWLASGNKFNPNQIKMLDQVASKIEFLNPMDQTDEEVIDMLNSGLDTVMSIIEPKTSEE